MPPIDKYLMKEFTEEIKPVIVAAIIDEVDRKDYARIGYHAETILNRRKFTVDEAILSKIEIAVTKNTMYLSRPHPKHKGDYEVFKDPRFKKVGFWSRHPFYEKLAIALVSALLTYIVGLLVSQTQRTNQRLIDKQQDSLIQDVRDSVTTFQKSRTGSAITTGDEVFNNPDTTK